jgi:hypothetical protein
LKDNREEFNKANDDLRKVKEVMKDKEKLEEAKIEEFAKKKDKLDRLRKEKEEAKMKEK